ncbi:ATP synthase subunit O, mitochondrial-like [Rosa rugosa]|uniref:ATP synthase subunit O, mitochondrial-like n=1 Tax=Rosa rugosa TaxID=74645 RepID=UPI002B40B008|nr:ATP synthase subunit O, mitochondrial-like [Rosa rugosa]
MAFANRLRSSLPLQVLVSKILRSEPLSAAATQRAVVCPSLTKSNNNSDELSRNFNSIASKKEEKVKLPLVLFGGYGKYASALYIAAAKTDSLDKVESEILDFVQSIKKTPELSQFTKDPTVPARSRVKATAEISEKVEHSDITKNFLAVLAEHGGLNHVEAIAKKFVELTMAHKGIVEVNVTSVIPLPAEEEKELKETMQEILGQGKTVKLEQKIDPGILGGLVVEFQQKMVDMSIKTRARQMERYLQDPKHWGDLLL